MRNNEDEFAFSDTEATVMLAAGLARLQTAEGVTQREVANRLGYKTSVVLSHMALGRVPIPVDRAPDIAIVLGLDPASFTAAVLEQRYPNLKLRDLFGAPSLPQSEVVTQLEGIAGHRLDELPPDTIEILCEILGSVAPRRRWISLHEVPVLDRVRRALPKLEQLALTAAELDKLTSALRTLN